MSTVYQLSDYDRELRREKQFLRNLIDIGSPDVAPDIRRVEERISTLRSLQRKAQERWARHHGV